MKPDDVGGQKTGTGTGTQTTAALAEELIEETGVGGPNGRKGGADAGKLGIPPN